jgi:tetratricopeptide (TPR) repeat protein
MMLKLIFVALYALHAMENEGSLQESEQEMNIEHPAYYDDEDYPRSPRAEKPRRVSKRNVKYRYTKGLRAFEERYFGPCADPHYFRGHPRRAQSSLKGLKLLDETNHPGASVLRSKVAMQAGLFDEAIEALEKSDHQANGSDRWVRSELVRARLLKTQSDEEIEDLRHQIECQQKPPHVIGRDLGTLGHYLLHGDRYFKRGPQIELAKTVLESAAQYGYAMAKLQLKACYNQNGIFKGSEEAQRSLEDLIAFKNH